MGSVSLKRKAKRLVRKTVTRISLATSVVTKAKARGYTLSHLIRILLEELLENPDASLKPKLIGDRIVCISLPEGILERAKVAAKERDLTLSQLIEALMEKWLEVTEELYS